MSAGLPLLPRFAEKFIQNFAAKRQAEASHQIEINRHRLYILPTSHGVVFFLVLLLILFGAINYENSLGFMLAFLLGSLGFLGMVYTHQNINKLIITVGRAESVFVGQEILFPLSIKQTVQSIHPNIQLLCENTENKSTQTIHAHLINSMSTECKLPVTARHRGYVKIGRVKIFSEYPLGLFHAWSWLNLKSRCLVYPAPDPHHYPLSFAGDHSSGKTNNDKLGVDDFSGIREYLPGDSPNHMAWKSIAKTGNLQTKLFSTELSQEISINWLNTSETLDIEKRLSILCRMVLDASENGLKYGLTIPGEIIPPSNGLQHKHRCLKALALFGNES